MKRTTELIFAVAFALLTLAACSEKEDVPDNNGEQDTEYDDAYYAAQATVTSSDANFTATDNGGEIHFKTEGGSVTLNVNCGCGWLAENSASDLFSTSLTDTALTITAGQNTVENELTGTITLMTESQRITFATVTVTQTAYGAPGISVSVNEWHAPAVGILTAEIVVEASADWTAETADEWLIVIETDSGIGLTVDENEDTEERSAKVTLTCTDGIRTAYEYITVNQDGRAYIKLSDEDLTLLGHADSATVAVETNFDDWSYDKSDDWLTVARDGNDLIVTAATNDGSDDREGAVTLTAGDGAENVTEVRMTVTQIGADAMVLTYTITSAGTSTQLPLYRSVNCTVDWGDGSGVQTVTSNWPSHTYTTTGEYNVIIKGTFYALNSDTISTSDSPLPITAVRQWGKTGLTDMSRSFYHCSNLASLPEHTGDALTNVTAFNSAFYCCSALKEIPEGLFDGCSKATTFAYTFYNCTSLRTVPDGLFSGCANVTTFSYTFYSCSSLGTIPSSLFNECKKVDTFFNAFAYCSSLKEIPSGLFDSCTEVTTFLQTFSYCSSLAKIPQGLFDNCTKVKNFQSTFFKCSSIVEIPSGLFDNCTLATTFYQTFSSCTGITEIPESLFDKCTNVESFQSVFQACSHITEIPTALFANCPEVTTFKLAFNACTRLTSIPNDLFSKNLKVTDFESTFKNNTALTGESPYDEIDGMKVHLYERENYPDIYATPTATTTCFNNCTGLSDYSSIPSSWR